MEFVMLADLEIGQAWQVIALACALGLVGILAAGNRRLRRQSRQLIAALDHMSQGLCMYDGSERLLLYNKRYIEM
jgi:PAS domain-containing protein